MTTSHLTPRRRVMVFTATRAEYGLLRPLIAELRARDIEVHLLVSGSHLSRSGGETWREIVNDGNTLDDRAEILLDADTPTAICSAMGLGLIRYGDALARTVPDMLVILGDRFEALAAATAGFVSHVPIVHLHGGEQTVGSLDEGFRHAITKLAVLHFTSTQAYRRRVIQLGESPDRVFDVGALGVENALSFQPLARADVEERLGLKPGERFLLLTFHPAALERTSPETQLTELIAALEELPDLVKVFTGANADFGGGLLNAKLVELGRSHPDFRYFPSLGAYLYIAAARHAEAVVGNSSSGIIEIPSLGVPVLDIGERQRGRVRASSVTWCGPERQAIARALTEVLGPTVRARAKIEANPYGKNGTARAIAHVIATIPLDELRQKLFHDLPAAATGLQQDETDPGRRSGSGF